MRFIVGKMPEQGWERPKPVAEHFWPSNLLAMFEDLLFHPPKG
jgi:hypothetical protein